MVRVLHVVVAASAVALTLAGCGGSDKSETAESSASSSASSAPASTTAAAASDEDQIRDLVQAQTDAFMAGDWDGLAEMTCAKYRDEMSDPAATMVPPISEFGTKQQVAALDPVDLAANLRTNLGSSVSTETSDRVAQAIIAYDEPAYQQAMLDAMVEASTMTVDKVDNIVITGDTATADVTVTQVMGDDPPQTSTQSTPFVREDGVWLDCSTNSGS